MSDKKQKLTPEQIKQIQQLQQMMLAGGSSPQAGQVGKLSGAGLKNFMQKLTPRNMLVATLNWMQNCVKFIDQFITFVVKEDSSTTNDVVKKARSPILFGTFVLIFFVFFGLIWSFFAPLDSAAVAIGTVISNSQKKIINNQEGGIIRKIYVDVGDVVKKDDKLIEFDDTRAKLEYENSINRYRQNIASESRLLAEINNDETVVYPEFLLKDKDLPEVKKIIETQDNLFLSKKEVFLTHKNSLEQRIEQTKKQIEGLKAKKIASQKTLDVTRDRLKASEELYKKGFAKKENILELQAREANVMGEIAISDTEIARNEQEITKIEIELVNLSSKIYDETLKELRQTQAELADSREKFYYFEEAIKRVIITSPVDGVVNNLNYYTIGSAIPPNHPIMEISPSDDRLIIEAKVSPKNIDSIKVGLVSKIRFSAFKSRTTPLFMGKVVFISPDIVIDQRQQMNPDLANGYYLARIELDEKLFKELAEPRKLVLQPGMQAEVQIVTGTRSLLQYLLDPVRDAMFKGFKEK